MTTRGCTPECIGRRKAQNAWHTHSRTVVRSPHSLSSMTRLNQELGEILSCPRAPCSQTRVSAAAPDAKRISDAFLSASR
jgi:hypothetical protein